MHKSSPILIASLLVGSLGLTLDLDRVESDMGTLDALQSITDVSVTQTMPCLPCCSPVCTSVFEDSASLDFDTE